MPPSKHEESAAVLEMIPEKQTESYIKAHDADRARRFSEREKRQPTLRRCLDPEEAATFERKKPRKFFKVTAQVPEYDQQTKKLVYVKREAEVEALNEQDAWALACDKWKSWPAPKSSDRKIVEIKRPESAV